MRPSASPASPSLPARYYRSLPAILESLGVDSSPWLAAAGLAQGRFDEDDRLSLAQVEVLCSTATELSGRNDLGWLIGQQIRPQDHAVVGRALLRSHSLDAALRMAARYFSLLHPGFQLRYEPGLQFGRLAIHPWLPFSSPTLRIHLEALFVALINELRALHAAPLAGLGAVLGMERPAHAARYRNLLRGPVRFDGRADLGLRIELPVSLLQAARFSSDDPTTRTALQLCEQSLERQRAPGRLAEWVRMMLREAQHELPDLPTLAAMLAMSPRTFARRLDAEGRGFRQLRDEVRMQRAQALLTLGTESVDRIASRLGYRDPANFRRAFRRIHGCPPRS